MTEPLTLADHYSQGTGETIGALPVVTETGIALPRQQLHDHPFMWALDAFVFAGPDAHRATEVYAQRGDVTLLNVHAYQIRSTTDGVMSLARVL